MDGIREDVAGRRCGYGGTRLCNLEESGLSNKPGRRKLVRESLSCLKWPVQVGTRGHRSTTGMFLDGGGRSLQSIVGAGSQPGKVRDLVPDERTVGPRRESASREAQREGMTGGTMQ